MKKDVMILVPAYNEAATIGNVIDKLLSTEVMEYCDILVINDGSSDDTSFIAKRKGLSVITHVFNLGYGSALQIGYKYAVRRRYKYVIQIDADGQHDICNIPMIYDKLRGVGQKEGEPLPDIVIGSRFLKGSTGFPISGLKKIAIGLFRGIIKRFGHVKVTDPTSGLQGLTRQAFLYYSRSGHFDYNYPDANMIIQMALLGFNIQEIPAVMHERKGGKSMHSGLKPVVYMFVVLLSTINVLFRHLFKKDDRIDIVSDKAPKVPVTSISEGTTLSA